jgi:hypothetical protein
VKRCKSINRQFAARRTELPRSPAYRTLSWSSLMVISGIEIELSHHGGNDNGQPRVTSVGFVQYGMRRTSVAPKWSSHARRFFVAELHCRLSARMPQCC